MTFGWLYPNLIEGSIDYAFLLMVCISPGFFIQTMIFGKAITFRHPFHGFFQKSLQYLNYEVKTLPFFILKTHEQDKSRPYQRIYNVGATMYCNHSLIHVAKCHGMSNPWIFAFIWCDHGIRLY